MSVLSREGTVVADPDHQARAAFKGRNFLDRVRDTVLGPRRYRSVIIAGLENGSQSGYETMLLALAKLIAERSGRDLTLVGAQLDRAENILSYEHSRYIKALAIACEEIEKFGVWQP